MDVDGSLLCFILKSHPMARPYLPVTESTHHSRGRGVRLHAARPACPRSPWALPALGCPWTPMGQPRVAGVDAQRGAFSGKGNLPPGPAPETQSRLLGPSPTPVMRNNWNTALGCQPVKKILNEIKTRALCLLLFLAAALDAAEARLRGCRSAWRARQRRCACQRCAPGDAGGIFYTRSGLVSRQWHALRGVCVQGRRRSETPGRGGWTEPACGRCPGKGPRGRWPAWPTASLPQPASSPCSSDVLRGGEDLLPGWGAVPSLLKPSSRASCRR